jgi:hypothetical protein
LKRLSLYLFLAFTANATAATVSLGNVSGNAGQTLTGISVTLQNQGAQISALQFDVVFDKTSMGITATTGTAASDASKSVAQNQLPTGLRVIVAGLGQDLIGDGTVANLKIIIGAAAASANYPLTLTNVQASDANGVLVPITGTSGNLAVGNPPALAVTKTHSGNFAQGQNNAAYNVTVVNPVGAGATSGTVTVTESVPSGLTLVSMAGTGWNCTGVSCARSDALSGGVSYPPITVLANVANNAVSGLTNQVTVSGGGSLSASASDATTINVPLPQTITFGTLSGFTLGSAPFTVSATASSGLPVSFGSTTQAVCTVSGSTVTIVATGTCSIAASQAGNATFAPATPVSQSFTVSPGAQTISFTQPADTALNAGPVTLTATATSTLAVSFVSNTPTVCTVATTSVMLVAKGVCSITASQAGNANFNSATPVIRAFNVTGNSNVITFPQPADTQLFAGPVNVTATANSNLVVSYTSNAPAVCTVAGSSVTLVSVGVCSLTANQAGDANFAAATAVTKAFNVLQGSQTITFGAFGNVIFGAAPFTVTATASSTLAVSFASNTPSICSISGSTVTVAGAGSCSITATQAGNASYAAAPPVTQTLTVAQGTQTIAFGALNNVAFGAVPFAVNATANSNLAVSFASTTPTVCSVTGNTVSLAGVGTCSITASQAGNANVSAATPVTQSFTVGQGSQTITFGTPSSVAIGVAPFTLNVTASSGLPVAFASTTQLVCTVAGSTVTIVTVGTCSITANQAGNANYSAATSVTQSFTVAAASQTITFAALPGVTFGVSPITLTATATSNLAVTFTSASQPVCTVAGSTVTIVAAGTCSITASQAGNTSFGAAPPVTNSFTVAQAAQTITFAAPGNVAVGVTPFALSATVDSGLTVTLTSATLPVCTVSGATVTVSGVGNCSITASQTGNANYLAATSVSRTFTVNQGPQTITFSSLSNVALGAPPLTLSATTNSGLTVSFASTTPQICTVSGTMLTLVAPGTCSVTASQAGNANYAAATPVVQGFSVAAGTQTITFGPLNNSTVGVVPFAVSATASSGLPVSFASTTPAVCTVTGSTVSTVAIGACSITASQAGNASFAAAVPIVQGFAVGQGSQIITFGPLSGIALGVVPPALSATASSGLVVAFTSTTAPVCTVTGTTVSLVDIGTCSITANQPGNANYTAATSVTQSFTVAAGSQTITFAAPAGVTFGVTPFTLIASTTSNLTLTFTSTTLPICTVAGPVVTIVAAGTCSITASQAGNTSFSIATPVSRSFTVSQGPQTITFAAPANVVVGVTPFALNATASSGLAVAFASTTPLVCTVSGTTVTVIGAGSCSVTASQPGNANYLAAPAASQSFTVSQGPQTITFAAPGNVALGVAPFALTATATSGLATTFTSGTLAVCSVAGNTLTVVAPGNCSVTASQAGNTNYSAATPVSRTFVVTGTQNIVFPSISNQALGTPPFQLGATATSGLPVSYASTTQAVCTVSGATVTLLSVGNCSLTASQAGNGIFLAGNPAMLTFNVLAPPACEYKLGPSDASISPAGGPGSLKILTGPGCAWTSTPNASFLTLTSDASGTDSSAITYRVAANTTGSRRTGTITVSGQTFTVNQFAATCSFVLSPATLDFTAAGGSGTVSVIAPISNCSWTGTAGDAAVTLSPGSGTAPSQLTVTVAANQGIPSRNLTATIGGQTLTLNQAGKNCSVMLGSSAATIPATGGPGSVDVTTQNGCSYSTVTGPSWISITSGGTGPGGTLFYTVDANSTTTSRTGAMNIGGQFYQITQPGLSCEISLDTSTLGSPFASGGGTGSIGILTSNPVCNWSASTRATWLSFNGPMSGTGAGTISITAAANGAVSSRAALVSIGGQLVNVSQAGTICTYGLRSSNGSAPASGGSGSVGVLSSPGCAWTSTSNASWLTITGSDNTGTGDVQFTAAANVSATSRSGTLTIAGQTYTVNQSGASCNYSLTLAGVNAPLAGVNNATVGFAASAAGCTANAISFSNWLTVSTALSGQAGAITYTAAANTGPARNGFVKLGEQTFSVSQAAALCSYTLASAGTIFGQAGGTGNIQMTASGAGCTPAVASNQTWATPGALAGPVSNAFTQPYTVLAYGSASNAVRIARIMLGGNIYYIKQTSW